MTRLGDVAAWLHSFVGTHVLARSRGEGMPVRVVMRNGRKRLDAPTVNYSFGTLHAIFAAALQRIDVRRRAPRSVLLLGLGGGSVIELLRGRHRVAAPIVAVEVDPEVVRLATEHFGLGRWCDLEVIVADALDFVATDQRAFDLVVVDVFVDEVVPAPFRETRFLAAARERMTADGMLLYNLITDSAGGRAAVGPLIDALRAVFPRVQPMPIHSNVVFAAAKR